MPTTRDVLCLLRCEPLLRALEAHGLCVTDRRVKADVIEARWGQKLNLDTILSGLVRDDLESMGSALDLDEAGMMKAAVRGTRPPRSRATSRRRGALSGRTTQASPCTPTPLCTFDRFTEIANFIWSDADLLRGDKKQTDYGKVNVQLRSPVNSPCLDLFSTRNNP